MDNLKAQQFRLLLEMAREIDAKLAPGLVIKPVLDSSLHGAELAEVYCGLIAHYSKLGWYVKREGTYALSFLREA